MTLVGDTMVGAKALRGTGREAEAGSGKWILRRSEPGRGGKKNGRRKRRNARPRKFGVSSASGCPAFVDRTGGPFWGTAQHRHKAGARGVDPERFSD